MRGRVLIELNGEERELRLDNNALALLEERLGCSVTRLLANGDFGIRFVREALYVGLLHEDRKLTPQKVGKLMDGADLSYLMEQVTTALIDALGISEEVEGEEKESQEED